MSAVIAHALFAARVLARARQTGVTVYDAEAARIGAQGPDMLYFHRVFPWEPGRSYARQGLELHKGHPSVLLASFARTLHAAPSAERRAMRGYIQGFLCHHALDSVIHPFVLARQEVLAAEQPRYSPRINQYHHRIESALDTLTLRRETGRRVETVRLDMLVPSADPVRDRAIAKLYVPPLTALTGAKASVDNLAHAPADMRQAMWWMTDRYGVRRQVFRPLETVVRQGPFLSALLRLADVSDWDYANTAHAAWRHPFDGTVSNDDYFTLYEQAVTLAVRRLAAWEAGTPLTAVAGDLDFSGETMSRI